jgi:hypothetical protein
MGTVFGPTVSGREVEFAALQTLRYWFETYLQDRELETGREPGSVARPRVYRVVNEFDDKNPEDQTPFIGIISDGIARAPRQAGKGTFMATWNLGIGVVIEASTDEASQTILKDIYCPVIVKIMLQKQSLRDWTDPDANPFTAGIDWLGMSYDSVAFGNEERTLWTGALMFEVTVDNVVNRYGGPNTPTDPVPGSDWPLPESGNIDFVSIPLMIKQP